MTNKRFAFVSILVVLMLLMGTVGAMAQTPPPVQPGSTNPGRQPASLPALSVSGVPGDVEAQALAMGKPGTTFRYTNMFGTGGQAYVADDSHLNGPSGLLFDATGNLFVTEEAGARLLKFDAAGDPLWQAGQGGIHNWPGTGFAWPKDVALAPDGTLWVANNEVVTHIAADGSVLGHFPEDPATADENSIFSDLRGVAFDSAGRMYLSDAGLDQIQIFSFDGEGNPVYETTLGGLESGLFFYPAQIAITADNAVFVADVNNFTVQECVPDDLVWPWEWNCSIYDGDGTQGAEVTQLSNAYGIGLAADGTLYIADSGNGRVKACTAANTCTVLVDTGLSSPSDVAVNPVDGKIYIADQSRSVVWEFTGTTTVDTVYAGTLDVAYLTDENHFYWPHGIEVDSKGSIIVLEENGQRVTKIAKDGSVLWSLGEPGVTGDDETHVAYPRVVTTDTKNKIYLGDQNGVRIFDTNGVFLAALPATDDNFTFFWVTGIAVDSSGNIYVADAERQRVTVYNKAFKFLRQVGVTDECGTDSQHFCYPMGIALDSSRNLYVTDWMNNRVQKFDKNGKFLLSFGTGQGGDLTGNLNGAVDVAVDRKGNVYVAEENNSRVTVFSKTGAFLTMVGGTFMNLGGLSLDKYGNLYATDSGNARVQVYAPGVPYWAQVNLNGFGHKQNGNVRALTVFKNQLYAAAEGWGERGGQIYRQDKTGWTVVMDDRFESEMEAVTALFVYQNYLYAGTDDTQLWRSMDGRTWQPVVVDAFGGDDNGLIYYPGPVTGKVCVSIYNAVTGAQLWCSPTGDQGTWELEVNMEDLGFPEGEEILALVEYNGATYMTSNNWTKDTWMGGQVWRKVGEEDWAQVNENGFGDPDANGVHSLAVFNKYLYAITEHREGGNSKVYRCQACDGSDWTEVTPAGLPDGTRGPAPALKVIGKNLYAIFGNLAAGMQVYITKDGMTWKQIGANGFGDANNQWGFTTMGVTTLKNALYIGVNNWATGGEVWKYCGGAKSCK